MKKPIYLYIEFFMCCLTYSYIAILYSICQCTVLHFLSRGDKKKKRRRKGGGKDQWHSQWERMGLDRLRKGETGCLWERRRQQEAGSGAASVVFWSARPTTEPPVRCLPDVVGCGAREAHFTGVGWDSVRCIEAAGGPAENGGATNLHCWAGVQMGGAEKKTKQNKTTERTGKQDRMLIYANAVTQIWKRLVALVGSWTEAWSSHVAPRAWGNLSPLTQPVHFSCYMFTARWSLEITGILFFFFLCVCLCKIFHSWGANPFAFGVRKTEHSFSPPRGTHHND